jgi:ABC-type multidrug transport system ATPase subunit
VTEPLVRIERISKRFVISAPPAIADLSAVIEPGRMTGLVGPDGAGKTTLLRLIAGLLLPDEGRLTVCGFDTAGPAADIHRVVAYMPQRFGLYEDLTVIENLTLYADLRSVVGKERREAFDRLLAFAGLAPYAGRLAGALSGGMKQKLGLACALIRPPRLLLLDEPSVGVDPISRRELWWMVSGLADGGIGVLWSTAYLDEAERCASVLLLNEGKLLFQGKPAEFTRNVEGRTYALRNIDADRRIVLSRALRRPDVIDGVLQGRSVRLVLAKDALPPPPDDLGAGSRAELTPVAPRFEDAFMTLLGGAAKDAAWSVGNIERTPKTSDVVVEAKDLTRRFGSFIAADRINFAVGRGEIFGLLGPNGAGKSTTFRMLCGLLRPSSGIARVAGLDLAKASNAARRRLGYMAQKFSLYGDLSVGQNLTFFAGIYGLADRRQTIERTIEGFGLGPHLKTNARALPLGFKQRLALACAVMHEPAVLFLDEPTSGVDPRTRREFWGRINAMVERGVTVLVTTHFLDEAEYCDRVGLVYRGNLIATGSPDELKDRVQSAIRPEPTLEDAFIDLVEAYDHKVAA